MRAARSLARSSERSFSPSRSCSRLRARPWRVAMKLSRPAERRTARPVGRPRGRRGRGCPLQGHGRARLSPRHDAQRRAGVGARPVGGRHAVSHRHALRPPLPALLEQRERAQGRLLRRARSSGAAAGVPRPLLAARARLPADRHGLSLHRAAAVRGRRRLRGTRHLPQGSPADQPRLHAARQGAGRGRHRVSSCGRRGATRASRRST